MYPSGMICNNNTMISFFILHQSFQGIIAKVLGYLYYTVLN